LARRKIFSRNLRFGMIGMRERMAVGDEEAIDAPQ
jgi:hypothetical protein